MNNVQFHPHLGLTVDGEILQHPKNTVPATNGTGPERQIAVGMSKLGQDLALHKELSLLDLVHSWFVFPSNTRDWLEVYSKTANEVKEEFFAAVAAGNLHRVKIFAAAFAEKDDIAGAKNSGDDMTSLRMAGISGQVEIVSFLMRKMIAPDHSITPEQMVNFICTIYSAARAGHLDVAQHLCAYTRDTDYHGVALIGAAHGGDIECLQSMLANVRSSLKHEGRIRDAYFVSLEAAAFRGDVDVLAEMMDPENLRSGGVKFAKRATTLIMKTALATNQLDAARFIFERTAGSSAKRSFNMEEIGGAMLKAARGEGVEVVSLFMKHYPIYNSDELIHALLLEADPAAAPSIASQLKDHLSEKNLHYAAQKGQSEIAALILSVIGQSDDISIAAHLNAAVRKGCANSVKVYAGLLGSLESIDWEVGGKSAIRLALELKNDDVIRELRRARVFALNVYGENEVQRSLQSGDIGRLEILKDLLEVQDFERKQRDGLTIFHQCSNRAALEWLMNTYSEKKESTLTTSPANVSSKGPVPHSFDIALVDKFGSSVVDLAVQLDSVEVLRRLLQFLPPINTSEGARLYDRLLRAGAQFAGEAVVAKLLHHGNADSEGFYPRSERELLDWDGRFPVKGPTVHERINFKPETVEGEDGGAEPISPFAIACRSGNLPAVRAMVRGLLFPNGDSGDISKSMNRHFRRELKLTLDAAYSHGYTPYMYALRGGHRELAQYLINQGADILKLDGDGERADFDMTNPLIAELRVESVPMKDWLVENAHQSMRGNGDLGLPDAASVASPVDLEDLDEALESLRERGIYRP
ncbi:ankyrin repeat domain-containing protein [Ottowia caeni]|uniref:ankyrin repeat domain-containing protein n=1 Tax=Ottowia caeni TaxID=2870339 RepID=UPI001E656DEB|nr:ankyrin repeat domain-containing protein [Ottowia caeni]